MPNREPNSPTVQAAQQRNQAVQADVSINELLDMIDDMIRSRLIAFWNAEKRMVGLMAVSKAEMKHENFDQLLKDAQELCLAEEYEVYNMTVPCNRILNKGCFRNPNSFEYIVWEDRLHDVQRFHALKETLLRPAKVLDNTFGITIESVVWRGNNFQEIVNYLVQREGRAKVAHIGTQIIVTRDWHRTYPHSVAMALGDIIFCVEDLVFIGSQSEI